MIPIVYFIRCNSGGLIKIGYSTDLPARLASLGHANAGGVSLLASAPGGNVAESRIHAMFREDRVRGEWFRPSANLLEFVAKVRDCGSLLFGPAVEDVDAAFSATSSDESAAFRVIVGAAIKARTTPFSSITQKALAQGIGVTRHTVNNWVLGKNDLSAYIAMRVETYLADRGQPGFLTEIYGDLGEPMAKRSAAE